MGKGREENKEWREGEGAGGGGVDEFAEALGDIDAFENRVELRVGVAGCERGGGRAGSRRRGSRSP